MEAVLGSIRTPLVVTDSESFVSRSTGRELARLTVEMTVHGEDANTEAEEGLSSGKIVLLGLGGGDDGERHFRVANHSSSYSSDEPEEHWHKFELEETEDNLFAQAVTIAGLRLRPYAYAEDATEGLAVYLRAVATPAEHDRLFELEKSEGYLDVVREGVNDQPEPMRFGRCLWQRDGEQIRQEVNLFDRSWDDAGHASAFVKLREPFESRAKEQLALRSEQIERLVDALVEAEVLDADQAGHILDVSESALERRSREYLRVRDLDAFLDD